MAAAIFQTFTPKQIIVEMIKDPDRFWPPYAGYDIGAYDVERQIALRNDYEHVEDPVRDLPLLNAAIEHHAVRMSEKTPRWLFDYLINSYDAHPNKTAINGIYRRRQRLEPPLHAAIRLGCSYVVQQLMASPDIDVNVRYAAHFSLAAERPFDCIHAGFAHTGLCTLRAGEYSPYSSSCFDAVEAGVYFFLAARTEGFSDGRTIPRLIEVCAQYLLRVHGHHVAPFDLDGELDPLFHLAIMEQMNSWIVDVIESIVHGDQTSPQRQNLLFRGYEKLLNVAVAVPGDKNPLVPHILRLATDDRLLPVPPDPSVLGTNPIAAALQAKNPYNAVAVAEHVYNAFSLDDDVPQDPMLYLQNLFRNFEVIHYGSISDENHHFFIQMLSVMLEDDDYIEECAGWAFLWAREADQNLRYVVTNFPIMRTVDWLWMAIHSRHLGYIRAILNLPEFTADVVSKPMPAVNAIGDVPAAPEGWTFLGAVVQARMLHAILLLLNRGANPHVVPRTEWSLFWREASEDWNSGDMERVQFVSIYMEYDFFQGDDLVGSVADLEANQTITNTVEVALATIERECLGL
ncbi:hypothetical protein F5B19DRAFT_480499 [Rostrohypoxylon terebratum]|nr:hypothetical protein F5B19DRAFT_480499 [Rostrohypoxylon terebratum]